MRPLSGVSDHEIVIIQSQVHAKYQRPTKHKIYIWKKANTEDLKKEMSDFSSNFTNTHNKDTPIDILWSLFKNSCNELLNKFVPSKTTSSRFSQPWINSDIKRLSRNKKKNLQQSNRIKNFQRLGTLQSLEIKVPIWMQESTQQLHWKCVKWWLHQKSQTLLDFY